MSERKRIYLCLAHMSEDGMEQKYVKEAFDTNWVVPLGPNVNGFEADLEKFVNTNPTNDTNLSKRVVALSAEFYVLCIDASSDLSWGNADARGFGAGHMEH